MIKGGRAIYVRSSDCIVCGSHIPYIDDAIPLGRKSFVCSDECYTKSKENSERFFSDILNDDGKLGKWFAGDEKVTHEEGIKRRLESI